MDYTGCGNSLKHAPSACVQLIMDSLRLLGHEMHVDGSALISRAPLARNSMKLTKLGPFLTSSPGPDLIPAQAHWLSHGTWESGDIRSAISVRWMNGTANTAMWSALLESDGGLYQNCYASDGSSDLYQSDDACLSQH